MTNLEQTAALHAVKSKKNIFLTGAGGVGKSHIVREILAWGNETGIHVAATAMTGCAAVLLEGAKTLHSWAGIGLARESSAELLEIVMQNRGAVRRWNYTQILVIDEVSMMTPDILEKLDYVARRVRKEPNTRFGGLQLVLVGDFCQLPPVSSTLFLFESPIWNMLIDETHNLVQIVRQKDPVFQQILTEARMGALTDESIAILRSRMNLPWQEHAIRPTLLYTRNSDVDRINKENMAALEGERRIYTAKTVAGQALRGATQQALEKLDSYASYDATLELCVGAQVMLLVNLDQERGLVNGSRGIVTGYSPSGLPLIQFRNSGSILINTYTWWLPEEEGIGRSQIPLKIAYALSIHKGQGATLDSALIDIGSNTFEYGQAYVALSRCRTLEGLYIWRFEPKMVLCHPKVRQFYTDLRPIEARPMEDPFESSRLPPAWQTIVEPRILRIAANIGPLAQVAPPPENVFAALHACPNPSGVKVILLGQDPYPTEGNAHGLSFSVQTHVKPLPASLKNIFKELAADVGLTPSTGCLEAWATQGVLLLNDVLTVAFGKPQSHGGKGWEELTAEILATVLKASPHVVILAWGRFAQKKLENPVVAPYLKNHTVLTAPHPSPLSAHTGFFGSKPFSQTNAALVAHGQTPIDWT